MSTPITDAEKLGKLLADTQSSVYQEVAKVAGFWPDWDGLRPHEREVAVRTAVVGRDRVCPPDHVVVPRAERELSMALFGAVKAAWVGAWLDKYDNYQLQKPAWEWIVECMEAIEQAGALGEQP